MEEIKLNNNFFLKKKCVLKAHALKKKIVLKQKGCMCSIQQHIYQNWNDAEKIGMAPGQG